MSDFRTRVGQASDMVGRLLSYVTAFGIFVLLAIVVLSVIFRYLLNAPLLVGDDFLSVFLGLTIFSAYPAVCRNRMHITVDLFTSSFARRPKFDAVRQVMVDLFVAGMTFFMAARLYDQGAKYQKRGTSTSMADIPLAPVTYVFVVLLAAAGVLLLLRVLTDKPNADKTAGDMRL